MIDKYGRKITYLRISVTDRCNFDCFYCIGENRSFIDEENLMKLNEIEILAEVFKKIGIKKVRITGGEPLCREDIVDIVRLFAKEFSVAMTTNGSLLSKFAKDLKRAGLSSVNVSLNSLKPETFFKITRGDLRRTLDGIEEALKVGISLKLNTVVCEHNFEELDELVRFAEKLKVPIRFIELMPIGRKVETRYFERQILQKLAEFDLKFVDIKLGEGPARYFATKDGNYVGVISALSKSFCESCNKIRVSCDGKMYPCLGSTLFVDLLKPLRSGATFDDLQKIVLEAVDLKPSSHTMTSKPVGNKMNQLGG
ncbi:GTP 3',8-cyclase MoaA [Pseudothermotoga thermarum]|uniref:GTP 3',8-cyclase n=1 Tax=Pseudothermotoga thermarum DSM 5069 TaxID=688269 RepID=F7YXI3_9THEM|nr:GTP 3',8-cyclase MoaA [Pseudothermotoga thermarum]AEH50624.1 molybdenum cofactor biosynthesis protein A [Pseudothermotoga thermarum DSM 5069]